MIGLIEKHRLQMEALCREFQVRRLDVFGSAAEPSRFDPDRSNVDFLVEFAPEAGPRLAALYLDSIAALLNVSGQAVDLVMGRAIRNPHLQRMIEQSRTTLYAACNPQVTGGLTRRGAGHKSGGQS